MITELIFDWARRTPDRTAVIYNGRSVSYRSFAQLIALARGYFARRGLTGAGHAVLAVQNLMDFWVLSLALRSLGLTTMAVQSAAMMERLDLPDMRCVVTNPLEPWPDLESLCAARGLGLMSVSMDGEQVLALDAPGAGPPSGGHILQTSGTTGRYKMVLIDEAYAELAVRTLHTLYGLDQV